MPDLAPVHSEGLKLLTNSSMKTSRRCKKLYWVKYLLGYRAIGEALALIFGDVVHAGLEAWWRWWLPFPAMGGVTTPFEDALAAMRAQRPGRKQLDAWQQAKAEAMLEAYDRRWAGAPIEPLAVEEQFRAPLVNPATGRPSRTFEMAGKLDVIARLTADWETFLAGDEVLIEHKTSSEDCTEGSVYRRRLRMDPQVPTYYDGAAALGYDLKGTVYDVLKKPSIKPTAVPLLDEAGVKIVHDAEGQRVKTKDGRKWRETCDAAQGFTLQGRPETPEEYGARCVAWLLADLETNMVRFPVVRLESEMRKHRANLWAQADGQRRVDNAVAAGDTDAAYENPDSCIAFGRPCDLFDVCSGVASLDNPELFKRLENPHTELAAEAATTTPED